MMQHSLKGQPYIELNKVLKLHNMVATGGEAGLLIASGEVLVNGQAEFQKRKKLREGDTVQLGTLKLKITA